MKKFAWSEQHSGVLPKSVQGKELGGIARKTRVDCKGLGKRRHGIA
jgi:hypothetical protein